MIASGINIAAYAGLLLGGHTVLHGITNYFLRVDTSITGYAGLLLGGRTILSGIGNSSPSFRNQYRRVLLGARTILSHIANSSPRVDCFRNLYRWVSRVTARWAYDFAWHS